MSRVLSNLFTSANTFIFGLGAACAVYYGHAFLTTGTDFWFNLSVIGIGSALALYEFLLALEEGLI